MTNSNLVEDFKRALDRCLHPEKNTDKMDVVSGIKYYYKVMITPFILSLVLATVLGYFGSNLLPGSGGIVGAVVGLVAVGFYFLILIPVGLLFVAGIIHLFAGLMLHIYKGDYSRTFTGVMFGTLPLILFYWISFIPLVAILYFIIGIWSIYVTVISLAKQHNISNLNAFIGWLISYIIIIIVYVLIIVLVGFGSLGLMHL